MTLQIRAENWGWRHASRRAWAVRNLNFQIEAGQRVLLLGPSGAGKSTLLSALAGVLGDANEGEEMGTLTIGGTHPRELKGHTALMMQDPDSQIVLTRVGDDVAFGCENMCVPAAEIWPRVDTALMSVGLDLTRDHPTNHLSGGEQQRLVLAGALAMGAEILILDEPTANLDSEGLVQVRDAVSDAVAQRTRTLIVVEHHCDTWAPLVDRVMVLTQEGLIADGPPEEVFSHMGQELGAMGVWVPQQTIPKPTSTRSLEVPEYPAVTRSGFTYPRSEDATEPDLLSQNLRENSDNANPSTPIPAENSDTHMGQELGAMGVWVPEKTIPRPTPTRSHDLPEYLTLTPSRSIYPGSEDASEHSDIANPSTPLPRENSDNANRNTPLAHNHKPEGIPILRTEQLGIGYEVTPIRNGLNLSIPAGASTVITGPNGSGKTTLALTLAGLLPPLEGSVEAEKTLAPLGCPHPHAWKSKELLTRIGMVFQSPDHQFVASTVFDEIAVGLRALKLETEQVSTAVTALLEQLRLTHLAKANPFTLSGGERRRLSVATVLACNPRVIILDEPTFGQDRLTWTSMVEIVTALRDRGTTVISVTHDPAYVEALGDHRIDLGTT